MLILPTLKKLLAQGISAQGGLTSSSFASDRLCVRHFSGSGRGALAWAGSAGRHGWLAYFFCIRLPLFAPIPVRVFGAAQLDHRSGFLTLQVYTWRREFFVAIEVAASNWYR